MNLSTDRWPAHNGRFACHGVVAECLPMIRAGQYHVITIRFKPSRWTCHPGYAALNGCEAWDQRLIGRKPTHRFLPPRHIRKAAKMALRRVMGAP